MESDWRKFRDMVPMLRERYVAECNARGAALLTNLAKTETDRFWDAMEMMKKEARILQQCLDGHSRSKMWLYMATMIRVGMFRKEDMDGFSEELQRHLGTAFQDADAERAQPK